jgi:DNA-binding winged helix-turn-helix (wHTH) protein
MATPGPPEPYRFGPFELQPDKRRLLKDGAPISLRRRAFDLLVALVDRAGHLVTKDELLARVWPKAVVEEAALHMQVSALRKTIGSDATNDPVMLPPPRATFHEQGAVVRGRGYTIVNDVSEREFLERDTQWEKGKAATPSITSDPGWSHRRDRQRAAPCDVAGRERPANSHRQHKDDDVQLRQARELLQPLHDAGVRRCDQHRHAAECGLGMKPPKYLKKGE